MLFSEFIDPFWSITISDELRNRRAASAICSTIDFDVNQRILSFSNYRFVTKCYIFGILSENDTPELNAVSLRTV
jgi:hypothetical protein